MDKLLEALKKLLPAEQMEGVSVAVEEMVADVKADLEAEFNKNLEEAYAELKGELDQAETVALESYQYAWDIITDMRNRNEMLRAEYDAALDEGYEEAYQQVLAERGKNETLEKTLHETYEGKFNEARDLIVNQLDKFLRSKGKEIYDMSRRDVVSDPSMVEHKIVLEKIVENVSDYIADEDRVLATSSKMDEFKKNLEDANGRIRMLEAKNIRLSSENTKLNEHVKQAAELLSEQKDEVIAEGKKERIEKAKNATGRGKVVGKEATHVVAEYAAPKNDAKDTTMVESLNIADLHAMQVLAGTKRDA